MESLTSRLSGSVVFSSLDCDNGYWQIPLDESAYGIFSIMLPYGVFSSTRCIQGSVNGTAWFQSAMYSVFGQLIGRRLEININGILAHSPDFESHFQLLREVFSLARSRRVKFALHKLQLFRTETKFCGRWYSAGQLRHDPERIQGLLDMTKPSTASQLMQFLCSVNWMRGCIVQYNLLVAPLQQLLTTCLSKTKRLQL